MKLSEEQQEICNQLIKYCYTPYNNQIQLITGAAGTGKTTLIVSLLEKIGKTFKNKIGISAPTHKAVGVLFNKLNNNKNTLKFGTIHSLFGLGQRIDGYGKVTYENDKQEWNKVKKLRILIVDEVSMLQDDLFSYILNEQNDNNLKIILVGDPYQIPPIGKEFSLPLMKTTIEQYNIQHHKLTKIIRQSADNDIIKLSTHIRQNICENNIELETNYDKKYIEFLKSGDLTSHVEVLEKYFVSKNFKQDPDYMHVISWTNAIADKYNHIIRYLIFKDENLPKLVVGENIVLDAPIFQKDEYTKRNTLILSNNDELEILSIDIVKDNKIYLIDNFNGLLCYECRVRKTNTLLPNELYTIKIIHEDSEKDLNKLIDILKKSAIKEKPGSEKARMAWTNYYMFLSHYAQFKYGYSGTIHRSQGKTYINCMVIKDDILNNSNVLERNRILYTGVTRPSEKLFIVQ